MLLDASTTQDAGHRLPAIAARSRAQAGTEWLTTEVATLQRLYPTQGAAGVQAELPHRTLTAIRAKASQIKLRCKRASTSGLRFARVWPQSDAVDQAIREGYIHAKAKGDIKALAERIGRPYWWIQKRGQTLGVSRSNQTRLDAWTKAEEAIVEEWAMCNAKVIARKLKAAGFSRTETAVAIRIKRSGFDRMNPDRWSATQVAPMLGVNPKTVADWIERRGLPAVREGGGKGTLMIERKRLRKWIAANAHRIDLRRVDQPWFCELMFGVAA